MASGLTRRKRRLLYVGGGLLLSPLLLFVLALAALQIEDVRTDVARRLIDLANRNMDEKLRLEGIERLDPWGTRVRHVLLLDQRERVWVDAHGVAATINLLGLLRGHVDIGVAHVERARIALHLWDDEDDAALDEADDADDDQPSGWRVTIPRASVGAARLDLPTPMGALTAYASQVAGSFVWQDAYKIMVRRAELAADLDRRRVLRAVLSGSDWSSDTGGPVALEGQLLGAALSARARLSGLDVDTPWPHGTLSLTLKGVTGRSLTALGIDRDWLKRSADLSLHAEASARSLDMRAKVGLGSAEIALSGKLEGDALSLSARVPPVRAESLSGRLPPGVLGGKLDVRYSLTKRSALEARWRDVILADVQIPSGRLSGRSDGALLVIDALTLAGYERNLKARGRVDLKRLSGSADVELRAFDLARLKVLKGEPLRGVLNGDLELVAERARLRVQGKLLAEQLRLRRFHAQRAELQLALAGSPSEPRGEASLRLDGLAVPHVPLERVALAAQLQGSSAHGHLEAHGKDVSAVLDLRGRRSAAGYQVNGGGRFQQREQKLQLRVQLVSAENRLALGLGLSGAGGKLDLRAQQTARGLHADFSADEMDLTPLLALLGLGDQTAELDGSGQLSVPSQRGELAFAHSSYRADLSLKLPLAPLLAVAAPAVSALSGQLTLELQAAGTLAAPQAELQAEAELALPERESNPEQLTLTASISPESSTAELVAKDLDGPLLRLDAQLGGPLMDGLAKLQRGTTPSFLLSARLAPRRLDLMQGVLAYFAGVYAFDIPVRVGGQLQLKGADGELAGSGSLRVTLFGDAVDDACVAGAQTDLQVEAGLQRGALVLRAHGRGFEGGKLEAELSTRFSSGDGGLQLSPATLQVRGNDILLPSLPGLCGLQGGKAQAELRAQGLGGPRPEAELSLGVEQLLGGDGPALDVKLKARLDSRSAQLEADVLSQHRRAARIEARLPLQTTDAVPRLLLDEPASARLALHELPVSPFLTLGEKLGQPRGSAHGKLTLTGSLRDPHLEGRIELKHVALSIASIAQPLRDINARIEVHGRKLKLAQLSARDRDGQLRLSGEAELARDWSGTLAADLSTHRFPIRRQGEVVGELTTKASFRAKLDKKLDLRGEVRIQEGRFWLTGTTGGNVQSLDRNTEIRFVDARGKAQALEEAREKPATAREELTLRSLTVKSDKDVWFTHQSFSVQLGIDLKLLQDADGEKLVGEVAIRRGHLELLGKPFQIEQGVVRLTGDDPPDPELELKASFAPPAGQTLYVEVHGSASSPIVSFSGAADTAEEAIAVVSGVGTPHAAAGQRAQSDARAFATNLTAGLLSATARKRLGDWVPLISVQSDSMGSPRQARAGFDASKLIPPFLRPLARGAYVEGIVGNTKQRRSGAIGLGVRLEVALPRDFVTSLGYGPGPNWETELTWVP